MDMYSKKMYVVKCIIFIFIFSPSIVKNNIVHSVFLAIHEQEISASSAEPIRGDYQLYLPIKLLNTLFAS